MRAGKKFETEKSGWSEKISGKFEITPQTKVADVLAQHPQSLPIFLRYGFGPLSNPVLRKTMARVLTVERARWREGVNLDQLLGELQQVAVASPHVLAGTVAITRVTAT